MMSDPESCLKPDTLKTLFERRQQTLLSWTYPLPGYSLTKELLDIPSAWILPHKRANEDKHNFTVQYAFTWAIPPESLHQFKKAFSMHQIGLKFHALHGCDRKSWFIRSSKGNAHYALGRVFSIRHCFGQSPLVDWRQLAIYQNSMT